MSTKIKSMMSCEYACFIIQEGKNFINDIKFDQRFIIQDTCLNFYIFSSSPILKRVSIVRKRTDVRQNIFLPYNSVFLPLSLTLFWIWNYGYCIYIESVKQFV